MDHQILLMTDIIVIFGLAILVVTLIHRLRLPALVGFIATGIVAGPHGFGLIREPQNVEIYAEMGIVALLFTIGLEFSFRHLLKIRKTVLIGGSLQVTLTTLAGYLIMQALGYPPAQALFAGFLLSLSSTAIVLKVLQERAELESYHGTAALGVLIFQDLVVVPMLLITPLLAGVAAEPGVSAGNLLLKGALTVGAVFLGARYLVPWVLFRVVGTKNRELFLLVIILICLSVGWLTHQAGLSLALGAFLAGLIISESEYSHDAIDHILPFRHIFTSFFFVSIGMMLDLRFFLAHPFSILALTAAALLIKTVLIGLSLAALNYPLRILIIVGLALSQIGEFSFILAREGMKYGILSDDIYQYFLASTVFTMALSPFLIAWAPRLAEFLAKVPFPQKLKNGSAAFVELQKSGIKDHLLIVGFGLNGRNVARAGRQAGIPYLIIEANPDTVKREKDQGEPIFYGDAVHETVLIKAGIKAARVLVVVINDPVSTRRITELAHKLNPHLHTIVRTRYLSELKPLYNSGATEVIPEEFETSVEIFSRVLRKYLIPRTEIERFIAEVRQDNYVMLRNLSAQTLTCSDISTCLPDLEVSTLRIGEKSPLAGKTLREAALPKEHGITVLAVSRDNRLLSHPDPDLKLLAGDAALVIGPSQMVALAAAVFSPPPGDGN